MTIQHCTRTMLVVIASAIAIQASAIPTEVVHQNIPQHCDDLFIPQEVDEIGDLLVFPPDEALEHIDLGTTQISPCPLFDDASQPNALVQIINFTGRDLDEVWYVANPETRISNFDGLANDIAFPISAVFPGQEAFRIDSDVSDPNGTHHPLVFESMTQDGIWEPLETWHFVLQDYGNFSGIAPDAINSIGVGNASGFITPGTAPSSGSIIAIPRIPEPTSAALALFSLLGMVVARR